MVVSTESIWKFAFEHFIIASAWLSAPVVVVLDKVINHKIKIPPIATVKATRRTVAIIGLIPFIIFFYFPELKYLIRLSVAEERVLTINLRKELVEKPSWKRKMSAARVLREVLYKHTRTRDIKIDSALNKSLLQGKNRIKIKLVKTEEGFKAELA